MSPIVQVGLRTVVEREGGMYEIREARRGLVAIASTAEEALALARATEDLVLGGPTRKGNKSDPS